MNLKHVQYRTQGTCSKIIEFDLDEENKIHNLNFQGGCPGNLRAISKLVEGMDAERVASVLEGNICRGNTSCADQLSKAIRENE